MDALIDELQFWLQTLGELPTWFVLTSLTLYFLPFVVARIREHSDTWPIFYLNLLIGWTVIGWIVCITWAFIYSKSDVRTIRIEYLPPFDSQLQPPPAPLTGQKTVPSHPRPSRFGGPIKRQPGQVFGPLEDTPAPPPPDRNDAPIIRPRNYDR